MCPFVEKKEKSFVFSLTYKYQETTYTIFSTPSYLPYYSNPPINNNYYNVQPPYYSNPSYYSGLESTFLINLKHNGFFHSEGNLTLKSMVLNYFDEQT